MDRTSTEENLDRLIPGLSYVLNLNGEARFSLDEEDFIVLLTITEGSKGEICADMEFAEAEKLEVWLNSKHSESTKKLADVLETLARSAKELGMHVL